MDLKHFTGLFGLHLPCRSYLFVAEMVLKSNSEIPKLCTAFFFGNFLVPSKFWCCKICFYKTKTCEGIAQEANNEITNIFTLPRNDTIAFSVCEANCPGTRVLALGLLSAFLGRLRSRSRFFGRSEPSAGAWTTVHICTLYKYCTVGEKTRKCFL